MRFREYRLPFAGVLLLAASGLTFAFATNEASESPGTAEHAAALAAATSVAVVRRAEHDRHAVIPASKRPAAVHIVAAHTLQAPVRSPSHVSSPARSLAHVRSRPKLRAATIVATVPVHGVAPAVPKHAALPSAAIARQSFSIVRFVGSKRTIARGDSVTLCARATGAAHLRIVPLGPIDPRRRTCRIVRPRKTTTYTLLAQSPEGGDMTQNVTIAVHKRTPPGRAQPPPNFSPGP